MFNMDDYAILHGSYIDKIQTTDNMFIRKLYLLAMNSAKDNKYVSIVNKDLMSNRGELADNSKKAIDKSVLDITKLTPLYDTQKLYYKTLMHEVADFRYKSLHMDLEGGSDFSKKHSRALFLDYMLASSLCYIEIFDTKTSRVDKFYATRNVTIASKICGIDVNETNKYISYLTPLISDYRYGHVKILKISKTKQGYKITQPRSTLDLNARVRITPFFLLQAFLEGIRPSLETSILKFKYVKDNVMERELITTLSPAILSKYYDTNYTQKVLGNCDYVLERGYIRLPELGGSRYDESGVRALNLSRITSIEVLSEVDNTFIDVDFNVILPNFKNNILVLKDINLLAVVYQGLLNQVPQIFDINILRTDILNFVDSQYALGTTTFLRFLHKYMLDFPMIFKDYSGKPVEFSDTSNDGIFNLGVVTNV